jgi:hypothetical protein
MTFSIVIMVGRGYFLPTHVHEASKFIMKYTFRPGQSAGAISKIIKGYGLKSKKTPARSVLSFFPPQAQLFLYRQYSISIVLNFPEENAILES